MGSAKILIIAVPSTGFIFNILILKCGYPKLLPPHLAYWY